MMPYQFHQLYEAERTRTAAEVRRADEQRGEAIRALSSAWHQATWPRAVLRALGGAVAGSGPGWQARRHGRAGRSPRTRPVGVRRADYLTGYHPSLPSGRPMVSCGEPGEGRP